MRDTLIHMEIQAFANRILASEDLETKLLPPLDLTDDAPGEPTFWITPARSPELQFASPHTVSYWKGAAPPPSVPATPPAAGRRKRGKMPALSSLTDPARRAVALHHFANHELMALELFAAALLAFPDMPPAFRRGLLVILADEQRHFQLYRARMLELGLRFGSLPVNDHFWRIAKDLDTPLRFVAALGLTFENGNLDYAQQYAQVFRSVGDEVSARVMETVHEDELMHVRFGLHWLRRLKDPAQSDWDAYTLALVFPTSPARARGPEFDRKVRAEIGMDEDFIDRLGSYVSPPRESTQYNPTEVPTPGDSGAHARGQC